MKNKLTILITALIMAMPTFSQTKTVKESNLEAHIIALEKSGWNAWKNKDVEWFRANTTEECLWVNADGISNKEQMMKSTLTDCEVSAIVPDDFNFVILNEKHGAFNVYRVAGCRLQ